jgi:hypothetical protein
LLLLDRPVQALAHFIPFLFSFKAQGRRVRLTNHMGSCFDGGLYCHTCLSLNVTALFEFDAGDWGHTLDLVNCSVSSITSATSVPYYCLFEFLFINV